MSLTALDAPSRQAKVRPNMLYANGEFSGYAALFGEVLQGHKAVIDKGAFTEWLAAWVDAGSHPLPCLWNHDDGEPVGAINEFREDDIGLWVRGRLNMLVARAKELGALMETGAIEGLSPGFYSDGDKKVGGIAHIKKVTEVAEVSIVTFPAAVNAHVDGAPMYFTDSLQLEDGSVVRTTEGYLKAFARVARTGIQVYKGSEVGRPDLKEVRVYRPESEVFSDATIASMANKPVTVNHPKEFVSAKNYRTLSVGHTGGEVLRDGEFARIPFMITDEAAVNRYDRGEAQELSLGYTTELRWENGQTTDHQLYDAVQTVIRVNHLAVVPVARGGADLRIGDTVNQGEGEDLMTTRAFIVDGVTVQMEDTAGAIVQRALARAEEALSAARKKVEEEEDKSKKAKDALTDAETKGKAALEAKDGEIAVLKKQVADGAITPQKLDELVAAQADTVAVAKAMLGDGYDPKGKTIEAIRKDVVVTVLGDAAKTMTDAAIEGAFTTLAVGARQNGGGQGAYTAPVNRLADSLRGGGHSQGQPHNAMQARAEAWTRQGQQMKDAWRYPNTNGVKPQ